jgi:hypothetical protein
VVPSDLLAVRFLMPSVIPDELLRSSFCGIAIRPSVARVLQDVEQKFGKPVRCEVVSSLTGSEGGWSSADVLPDGTPRIKLDKVAGRTENEVILELLHLQLIADGFPDTFQLQVPMGVDANSLANAARQLNSLIQHRLTYPKMREMGFDPTKNYRPEIEHNISGDRPPPWSNQMPILFSVHYARVALLVDDPGLSRDLESWYKSRGWVQYIEKGKLVISSILAADPKTPDQATKELVACLNILFEGKFNPL